MLQCRVGLTLAVAVLLTACAGRGDIAPQDTAGAIVMVGMSTEGRPVTRLGHYYVLNFIDAEDREQTVVARPQATHDFIIIDELAPGEWTLDNFALRSVPGTSGFADTSLRQRPVRLNFPVVADSVQVLSHELVINHRETWQGLTATEPRMAPLSSRTRDRVERRIDRLGPEWQRVAEPVGIIPEREEPTRRPLLERILGD